MPPHFIYKEQERWIMEAEEKNIFDVITEYSINDGMDKTVLQNKDYIKIQRKIREHADELDRQHFSREQRLLIDRLVCAHAESGAFYGKMTYRQGFRDCITLLKEMELLRAS